MVIIMNDDERKIIKDYKRNVKRTLRVTEQEIKNTEKNIEDFKKDIKTMKIIMIIAPFVIYGAALGIIKLGLIASGINTVIDSEFLIPIGIFSVCYEPMMAALLMHNIDLKKYDEEKLGPLTNKKTRCEEILETINQTLENKESFPNDYVYRFDPNVEMTKNRSNEEENVKVRKREK